MLRSSFTEELESYTVQIEAKRFDKQISVSDVYDEYHPLMALGRAIVEFKKEYVVTSIETIAVFKKTLVPVKQDNNR